VNRPAPGAGGEQVQAERLPGLVYEGTDANFSQFLDLSTTIPVIVDLYAEWADASKELSATVEKLVTEYAGRFVLVKVDVEANRQLAQAFQAQSVPTVAAVIGGRPVTLFPGVLPEEQIRDVFEQLLQLAAQNGVTGRAAVDGAAVADAATAEPEPEPLPPLHQEAYDAIERGDYTAAVAAYRTAIAQDPRDSNAVAGLAQVSLLARLSGLSAAEVRATAAEKPKDVDAQLAVADLDISGGHVEDAFDRLLQLFAVTPSDARTPVRERLLEYFEVVGTEDPRVTKARSRLAALLY
jgi:putative thioredoxin